jgi:hypothetical protein
MVAYAASTAVYINNPKDIDGTSLKKLGYGYGDHLRGETHPLMIKKN